MDSLGPWDGQTSPSLCCGVLQAPRDQAIARLPTCALGSAPWPWPEHPGLPQGGPSSPVVPASCMARPWQGLPTTCDDVESPCIGGVCPLARDAPQFLHSPTLNTGEGRNPRGSKLSFSHRGGPTLVLFLFCVGASSWPSPPC